MNHRRVLLLYQEAKLSVRKRKKAKRKRFAAAEFPAGLNIRCAYAVDVSETDYNLPVAR